MATSTTRIALRKPDPSVGGDNISVANDLNGNWDKVDAALGFFICTSGTRPTTAAWQGMHIYETDTGKAYVATTGGPTPTWVQLLLGTAAFVSNLNMTGALAVTGTAVASSTITGSDFIIASGSRSITSELNAVKDAHSTWTPVLTNLTQGNGTITARHRTMGKTIFWRFKFTLGTTSAVGSAPKFTLPAALHASYVGAEDVIGRGTLLDSGTANHPAVARLVAASSTQVEIFKESDSTHNTLSSTVPFTWVTNDVMSIAGFGELA